MWIGWLEFELLARWREHGDAASLIRRVSAETTLRPALEEVQELIAFLANQQLLAPASPVAPATARANGGWVEGGGPGAAVNVARGRRLVPEIDVDRA